ncbi:MAG: Protease 3 precursor [Candidatus Accumulibacter adjunctus]|uniref:Protease 3 n=1 Tax=Candidatus Accumulibacter adjunctus TaxID=1454001 RepID=A0A011PNK8_9PROT|nr:MAG: Protease 3 precursor [Candidatus Accumulibacter adjunctus]
MNNWSRMVSGFLAWLMLALLPLAALAEPAKAIRLPTGVTHVATVEGISEYRLANGLRAVLFPDAGKPTATVNVTYLVGSRHENYGETGMAHLLEHLIFKGSKRFPDPTRQFQARGFDINGSTSLDRTNYYLTFPASDGNLRWALDWSADAMVHSFIARKDLESEMSVVRNEYEMGENEPASVLFKRMQSLLFDWHNYGNSTIGARSDIENVRIENLQAFYRRFYQPDNAVLTVAGKFDEQQALDWIAASFGKLPRPKRRLPEQWTVEPTADGERQFVIRRKGEVQLLTVAYRTPASLHPDSEAIAIASDVLGDTPNGRLYRALVQTGMATQVFASPVETREPGFVLFGAILAKDQSIDRVREAMIEAIEGGLARQPTTAGELERALAEARTSYERALTDPESFAVMLSEYIALGDWRLFFHARDQLDRMTTERVDAAAARYLVRDNRVVGVFIPDDAPQRAVLPKAPTAAELLAAYRPATRGDAGEAFDPSYENLGRRTRLSRFGDLQVALLPKKNRGQTVNVAMSFRWGDEQSLRDRKMAGALAIAMLPRGSRQLSRQQIADEMTRLKVRGGLTQFETARDRLPEALALAAQLLGEPSFPPAEFEELRREYLTALQAQLDSPEDLASDALAAHFNTYPPGDPRHHTPLPERIEQLRRLQLADVVDYQHQLVGTARGEIAIVGDFDAQAIEEQLRRLFADARSRSPYERLEREFRPVPPARIVIDTPDRENAVLRARLDIELHRDDADAAALFVANYIFGNGGGLTSRLMDRLRQQDGLSYSVASSLSIGQRQRLTTWTVAAMVAPQNAARAEQALGEEIRRARDKGFTATEVAAARKGIVEASAVARSQDSTVASRWTSLLDLGRDWRDSQDFETRIMAVSAEQASAAFRKYIDPERMTLVLAGDASKGLGK